MRTIFPRNKVSDFFIGLLLLALMFYLDGCSTMAGPSKAELRQRLDAVAEHYEEAKAQIKAQRAAGAIDDATWAMLKELDLFFAEQWSAVVVDLNAGHDWQHTLEIVVNILSVLRPYIAAGAGHSAAGRIDMAMNISGVLIRGPSPPGGKHGRK